MTFTELVSVFSGPAGPFTDQLRLAVTTYLARLKGTSREHTESDLCCYLFWGAPSAAGTGPRLGRAWSCTSGGCRRSAGPSSPPSPRGAASPRARCARHGLAPEPASGGQEHSCCHYGAQQQENRGSVPASYPDRSSRLWRRCHRITAPRTHGADRRERH